MNLFKYIKPAITKEQSNSLDWQNEMLMMRNLNKKINTEVFIKNHLGIKKYQ